MTVRKPHPLVWAKAVELARGQLEYLHVENDGSVVVMNSPRLVRKATTYHPFRDPREVRDIQTQWDDLLDPAGRDR